MFIPISAVLFFTETVFWWSWSWPGLGLETTAVGLGLGTLFLTTRLPSGSE